MSEGAYIMDRIRARCHEDGDCLIWDGAVDIAGAPAYRQFRVRREAWQAKNGKPAPKGKVVINCCGRARCIEHLGLSTRGEVLTKAMERPDSLARKRLAAKATQRSRAKLDEAKVAAIRASDKPQRELAKEHGVANSLISRIRNNQAWRDAKPNPFAGLMA